MWMPKAKKEGRRSGASHKGKSTEKRCMGRRYSKRSEENIQNTERSIDKHRNRKGRYTQRHNSKSTPRQRHNRNVYGLEDGSKIWI